MIEMREGRGEEEMRESVEWSSNVLRQSGNVGRQPSDEGSKIHTHENIVKVLDR